MRWIAPSIVFCCAAVAQVGCTTKADVPSAEAPPHAAAVAPSEGAAPAQVAPEEKPPAILSPVRPPNAARPTTDGRLALSNLDSQLDGYASALAVRKGDVGLTRKVLDLRLMRTQFTGRSEDFGAALTEVAAAVAANPKSPEARLLSVRIKSALHRFDEALVDLDAAAKHGASASAVARQRASIEMARGIDGAAERLLAIAEANAAKRGSFAHWSDVANARWKLGRYAEADAAFQLAADAYRNTGPFALAWVDFQRGVMWAETADEPERALPHYRSAVERLPGYHVAAVHYAELLDEAGRSEEAIAILRPVASSSQDPEPAALLSALLKKAGKTSESSTWLERATAGYERVLTRYPAAYADHGAEFFITYNPDHDRARALALANLRARPTADAFDLAIGVHLESAASSKACDLALDATRRVKPTPVLASTVRQALAACEKPLPEAWGTNI